MRRPWQPANSVVIHRDDGVSVCRTNVRMRDSLLTLVDRLITGTEAGITHLALGDGIGTGTLALPQAPNANRHLMFNEIHRLAVDSVVFDDLLNEQGDTYSDGTRTNRVLVSTEVPLAQCSTLITEVALFGGAGASDPEGGTIFAWSTFPVIDNRDGGTDPEAPKDLSFDWVLKFPLINAEEQS